MANRPVAILDLHLRRTEITMVIAGEVVCDAVDRAVAAAIGGECPSWNASTMCVQVLQRWMSAQGWENKRPEPIRFEGLVDELPKRPLDVGVMRWR